MKVIDTYNAIVGAAVCCIELYLWRALDPVCIVPGI